VGDGTVCPGPLQPPPCCGGLRGAPGGAPGAACAGAGLSDGGAGQAAQSLRLAALAGAVRAARSAIAAGRALLHELRTADDPPGSSAWAPQLPGSSTSGGREEEAAAPQLLLELLGAVPGDEHAAVELVEKLGRVLSWTAAGAAKASKVLLLLPAASC
jgi:hypothetical protein